MKQFIREYFTFNKRERNGIFVLLFIIASLICYLTITDKCIPHEKIDFSEFEREIQAFKAADTSRYKRIEETTAKKTKDEISVASIERFPFNPNHLSENDWKKLGLSDKQITSIKKYEAKGGNFQTKEDVKKLYVISPELYKLLEPYIVIPVKVATVPQKEKFQASASQNHSPELVELNTADSTKLTQVRGIGPFYASAIIKYRNVLGGFITKKQLLELWKFDEEKYIGVEKQLTVDPSKIKKININTCTSNELKHPYLNWKLVNGIINFRTKHGNFQTVEAIKQTELVQEELFLKIAPYLSVGQ